MVSLKIFQCFLKSSEKNNDMVSNSENTEGFTVVSLAIMHRVCSLENKVITSIL